MIYNHTTLPIFDSFIKENCQILENLYPNLQKFQIHIVTPAQYCKIDNILQIGNFGNDSFQYSINPHIETLDKTIYCAIVYNEAFSNATNLTKDEVYAGLTHEIGHIVKNAHNNNYYDEIIADDVAYRLSLIEPLMSLLRKLLNHPSTTEYQKDVLNLRLSVLEMNIN